MGLYSNINFPESIDTIIELMDITVDDAEKIKEYQVAIQSGNIYQAETIFNTIQDGERKIVNATYLNKLNNILIALESFYLSDIKPYTDSKQLEWQGQIDLFNYLGSYSPSIQYEVNNFIEYSIDGLKNVYICIEKPTIGTPPTNSRYWRILTVRGMKGESGKDGATFLFDWQADVNYYEQNIVSYQNSLWGAKQESYNNIPFDGSDYWEKLVYISPSQYPFQKTQPTVAEEGDLWFKIL